MATHLLQPDAAVLDHAIAMRPLIEVEGGHIRSVRPSGPGIGGDAQRLAGTLLPGLIDLQVNGAGGRGCDEASPSALDHVAHTIADHGAAAFLPTLITAPIETLVEQVHGIADWIETDPTTGAIPLGIHLEGPFLSNAGAHDPDVMIDPQPELVDRLIAAGRGTIRLVTLSPSRRDAASAVAQFRAAGITVALGHGSGQDGIAECVAAGATMATHLFNAMGPSDHRDPGMPGRIMDDDALSCSMIVDDIHVHPMRVRLATKTIGMARTVLVTDCVSAMGMPDGDYKLGASTVTLRDGAVRNADGTLAGSALTMFGAVANFRRAVPTAGPWTLALVASTNPARLIGPARMIGNWEFGRIAAGCAARFTLLDDDGSMKPVAFS